MVIQYRSLGSSATLKSSSFYFYVPSESDYSCGGLVSFYDVVFYCDFFCYTECFFFVAFNYNCAYSKLAKSATAKKRTKNLLEKQKCRTFKRGLGV